MKKFLIASALAAVLLPAQVKAQTDIVFYSFNDTSSTAAVMTATVGSSISSFSVFNPSNTPLTILSSVGGNPNNHGFSAGNSVSQNTWDGTAYFQFTLDSTGYKNIILSWAGNTSSTGPTNVLLRYSSTGVGGPFTDFATFASLKNTATTQDLTSVTALNNNPNDVFRIVGINSGNPLAGTMKIDNFNIDAVLVPEPSTLLLVGAGLLGLLAVRRRRT